MEHSKRISNKPSKYAKIPLSKRMKLIQLVLKQRNSIAKAASLLSICLSTAKLIIKKYKEEGAFFQKKQEKKARLAGIKKLRQNRYIINEGNEQQSNQEIQPPKQAEMLQKVTCIIIFDSLSFEIWQYQNAYWSLFAGANHHHYLLP